MVNNFLLSVLGLSFAKVYSNPTWNLAAVPNLDGKIALVTGGNTGLGYQLALTLAQHGAKVIITTRTKEKGRVAVSRLKDNVGNGNPDFEYLVLDQSNTRKTQEAADTFLRTYPDIKLNILILNAGTLDATYHLTDEGIESHFAVNYLCPFIFAKTLMSSLAPRARVVVTSAYPQLYPKTLPLSLKNVNERYKDERPILRYGISKLCAIFLARELQKRMGDWYYINSCHPGQAESDLLRTMTTNENGGWLNAKFTKMIADMVNQKPEDGILTQLYLATSPEVLEKGIRGKYYVQIAREGEDMVNAQLKGPEGQALGRELWEFTERLVEKLNRTESQKG